MERCSICGCKVHRNGDYAKPSVKGRSHATRHHYKIFPILYEDIAWNGYDLREIVSVSGLTNRGIPSYFRAHLDPDLNQESLTRHEAWKPIFGQVGTSQGHLRKQRIEPSDIFLFFGSFQKIITDNHKFQMKPKSSPMHVIWGWLQVDGIISVDKCDKGKLEWAIYHPHFHRPPDKTNTVYVAKGFLDISVSGVST